MGKKKTPDIKTIRTIFMMLLACISFIMGFTVSDKWHSKLISNRQADIPYIRINPRNRLNYQKKVPVIFYPEIQID